METPQKEQQRKKVLIIGGGIQGLTTAYYLDKRGNYDVTIVDKEKSFF